MALKRRKGKVQMKISPGTWVLVEEKIREDWSPEQISGRLKIEALRSVMNVFTNTFMQTSELAGPYGPIYAARRNAANVMANVIAGAKSPIEGVSKCVRRLLNSAHVSGIGR